MDGPGGYCAKWSKTKRKTNTVWYHLYVKSKKIKRVNIRKQKQTHRYREQTSGYQWGEGRGEGQAGGMGLRDTKTTVYKIDKQQGYVV